MRILLLGNSEVGKSTLINRLSGRPLPTAYRPTTFYAVSATLDSEVDIIEVPGAEMHRTLPLEALASVDRIVVMLAMDDAETLYTHTQWIQNFQHLRKPIRLLVNKSDLDAEPQTTVFTLMSLHNAGEHPWEFISCWSDTRERLMQALIR
jgi:small GTP-binding protein